MFRRCLLLLMLLLLSAGGVLAAPKSAPPPDPAEVTPDPWPRVVQHDGLTYTIYQPQLESWNGYLVNAHSAVAVQPAGAKEPTFGVVNFTAKTRISRSERTVEFTDMRVQKALFPAAGDQEGRYRQGFEAIAASGGSTMSLDRFEAMLAVEAAEQQGQSVPVKNDPPRFIFTESPAILVPVQGEPSWHRVAGSSLERVVNTRALLLLDNSSGSFYLALFDGFVTAKSLDGPWSVAKQVPESVSRTARQLAESDAVDLLTGEGGEPGAAKPTLKKGAPQVYVSTVPAELVVTQGAPQWAPLEGTRLLYVPNSSAHLFKSLDDQQTYLLVTGRWFRAPNFDGPWQYVPPSRLPKEFAKIPEDSPKENVKASVPGTRQAQEALTAAHIPQMATIDREQTSYAPVVKDPPEPVLRPIEGTSLQYMVNSAEPVIMVAPGEWFTLQNGVWFVGPSSHGPWSVATSIPAAIYAIPPSSPLHYVTYVKIYDVTPKTVVVGYTPGYYGAVVSDSLVVYGTGYYYPGYWSGSFWYPAPFTFGLGASISWTPWTGWSFGFGFGWPFWVSYACAPYPWWGPMYYPHWHHAPGYRPPPRPYPGRWSIGGNVYQRWGRGVVSQTSASYNAWSGNRWSSRVGTSYNSTTGRLSAGQRASVTSVYTGWKAGTGGAGVTAPSRAAARRAPPAVVVTSPAARNNYYAGKDGTVYRGSGESWQKYANGRWQKVQPPQVPEQVKSQQQSRRAGDARSASSSWGSPRWGGGFSRDGAPPTATRGSSQAVPYQAPRASSGGQRGGWDRGAVRGTVPRSSGGGRSWGGGGWEKGGGGGVRFSR